MSSHKTEPPNHVNPKLLQEKFDFRDNTDLDGLTKTRSADPSDCAEQKTVTPNHINPKLIKFDFFRIWRFRLKPDPDPCSAT